MANPLQNNMSEGETSLENRLRGLILNNGPPTSADIQPILAPALPPHMKGASPAAQQAYFQRQVTDDGRSSAPGAPLSPGGRKRPNQAQRRQMNSQLSLPVDTRPVRNAQAGREYVAPNFPNSPRNAGPTSYGRPQGQHYSAQSPRPSRPPNQAQPPVQYPVHPGSFSAHGPYVSPDRNFGGPPGRGYADSQNTHQQRFPQQANSHPIQYGTRVPQQHRHLYQPGSYGGNGRAGPFVRPEDLSAQSVFLQALAARSVALVGIDNTEIDEKEAFRALVERACREAIVEHEQKDNPKFDPATVELKCFGSMASGFATKASDMDLALLTPRSNPAPDSPDSPIPRILERKLLDLGLGARLLTRTRVPIIKLCQKPTEKLMSDLVEERLKWENGFSLEDNEDEDGTHEEGGPRKEEIMRDGDGDELTSAAAPKSYEQRLALLKQKPKESLGDYYGDTKRLLRQLGGRDITSAAGNLNPDETMVLVDVCRAFVNGLLDEELRSRLLSYASLDFSQDWESSAVRSLSGVYNQVEGERLVMAWSQRPLAEVSEKRDYDCLRQIEEWQKLGEARDLETMVHGRQLYVALDRLKHISSLQLVFLEQGHLEDPILYHARADKILRDLGDHDQRGLGNNIHPVMIDRYIAGIRDKSIQKRLSALKAERGLASLQSVATYHRILQLSDDYEKGLAANIYSEVDRPVVQKYVDHVRGGTDIPRSVLVHLLTLPDPTPSRRSGGTRDRYYDRLEFSKHGIGVQCDVNFSAQLALHNTQLLRCYSASDPRVKPLVLFVKHWAKARNINTPYRGTLSSYGYVLMVLHYLVNVTTPFVCPNLQLLKREPPTYLPPEEIAAQMTCLGRDVQFWRNEKEIKGLSERGMLNHNKDSIGALLRGFFEYYAQNGPLSTGNGKGFDWGREVLSLRTAGGLVTKQEKGWVGARTVTETTVESAPASKPAPSLSDIALATATINLEPTTDAAPGDSMSTLVEEVKQDGKKRVVKKEETKEIRHRYLFAIEDPFELDHNVARTVTHNGIVSIRDEFRRAWRLIREVGRPRYGKEPEDFLAEVVGEENASKSLKEMLEELHGRFDDANFAFGEKKVEGEQKLPDDKNLH